MGKMIMTNVNVMKGSLITVDSVDCYPSDHYPNSAVVHTHDFYEIEWIISGAGTLSINSIPLTVHDGYCSVISPGEYHTYALDTRKRLVMYNIKFKPDTVSEEIRSELEKIASPLATDITDSLSPLLSSEIELLSKSITENPLMAKNALERILIALIDTIKKNEPENAVREIEQIRKITDYVSENYKSKIILSEIAKLMNLSENYLGIYFKKHTGQRFSDYVRDVRVCRAAQLLGATRLSVKEVAYRTGFCSAEYLSRSFKKFFGISPIEYRKKNRSS